MFNIIFVIGGPAVGKGTQCSLLVNKYPNQSVHISLGDVLREERGKLDSKWGTILRKNLKEGLIGPKEMVVSLLEEKLKQVGSSKVVLLDGQFGSSLKWETNSVGFPRTMDRCLLFEKRICKPVCCVALMASKERLLERLYGRRREDDEAIEKRLQTWNQSSDIIEHYRSQDKLIEIDAEGTKTEVFVKFSEEVQTQLGRTTLS